MDFVILSNDQVLFDAFFSPAIVVPVPGTITGSALCRSGNRAACVVGDEATVQVPGVAYTSGGFLTPGVGILSIMALAPDQQALNGSSGNRPFIVRGSQFRARFQVMTPATNPMSGFSDVVPTYFGAGSFLTTNAVWRAN